MSLVLVTPPADEPVTLDEAKTYLVVEHNRDDTRIASLIRAVRQTLDGRDGWLGRALITQVWDLRLDRFCSQMMVPLPPLQEVVSVKYLDVSGAEQTMSAANYRVIGLGGADPAMIELVDGQSWPEPRRGREPITIRFRTGYGDAGSDVPMPIRESILQAVADRYRQGETFAPGVISEVPMAVGFESLLSGYRVWAFT